MTPKVFSPCAARKVQAEYCRNNNTPHFAPLDGICFRCKKDIYQQHGIETHRDVRHQESRAWSSVRNGAIATATKDHPNLLDIKDEK